MFAHIAPLSADAEHYPNMNFAIGKHKNKMFLKHIKMRMIQIGTSMNFYDRFSSTSENCALKNILCLPNWVNDECVRV